MLKVTLLCSDAPHHLYLASQLARNFSLSLVVVEPGSDQEHRFLKRRRYRDYFAFKYHGLRRKLQRYDRYRQDYFKNTQHSWETLPADVHYTSSINASASIEKVQQADSDITIVIGTSIIGRKMLAACKGDVINIHGGYLPYYKGNNCFFFAMYNGEFDKIGSTIHFVNQDVDAGDIIEVVRPEILADDNPETLYSRAEKKAIHRLVELLRDLDSGKALQATKQAALGRQYFMRDRTPAHDLIFAFKQLLRKFQTNSAINEVSHER